MKNLIIIIIILLFQTQLYSQTQKGAEEAKGLLIGDVAPDFSAVDSENQSFHLTEALQKGPVVLIFYRGFWCPVCNQHLAQIQDSLQMIEDRGAQVIAISPEKPEYLGKMAESSGAQFTLLYDESYRIATTYDVNYKPKSTQLLSYNLVLGAKMKQSHTMEAQNLPIPATYIINQNGEIIWRQFDPDYKKRSSVKEILNHI